MDDKTFARVPDRFLSEIVASVLENFGVPAVSVRQDVAIAHADFDLAQELDINVNSAVFRESFDAEGKLICSARLLHAGDIPGFDNGFTADQTGFRGSAIH